MRCFLTLYTAFYSKKRNGVSRPLTRLFIFNQFLVTIRIDQISSICWNKKAFDRLVLPERTKDLIKSLVLVRTTKVGESRGLSIAGKRKDIIAGKGNGLIMLLHGAPGTGKTLTAGISSHVWPIALVQLLTMSRKVCLLFILGVFRLR
jgi:hypothetical protein